MPLSQDQRFEPVGGILGVLVAYLFFFLGVWAVGRPGIFALAAGVPFGVLFCWIVAKLLPVVRSLLSEAGRR